MNYKERELEGSGLEWCVVYTPIKFWVWRNTSLSNLWSMALYSGSFVWVFSLGFFFLFCFVSILLLWLEFSYFCCLSISWVILWLCALLIKLDSSEIAEKSEIWDAEFFEVWESESDPSVDLVSSLSCSFLGYCFF